MVAVSTGGAININGAIETYGHGDHSGAVSLSAAGTISVNGINTSNQNYEAGNIFISSGASGLPAVSLGAVDTSTGQTTAGYGGQSFFGANVAGSNGPSPVGNANISFTLASTYSGTVSASPYLFYNGNPSSITTDTTISVEPSLVVIFPGVYTTDIGSAVTPVAITLDLNGDSRTIVPVISSGNVYLSGFSANNAVGGSLAYQKNGYEVLLLSNGGTGIVLSGDVTAAHFTGGNDGNVSLAAFGSGGISQSAGTISGNSLLIYSTANSIGSSGNPVTTDIAPISAFTSGSGNVYVSATNPNVTIGGMAECRNDGDCGLRQYCKHKQHLWRYG